MRIHLVGVSGAGMGALAALLREAGDDVSGSDAAFESPAGPALEALGVTCMRGYDAAHLEPAPDLVVVGSAIRQDNPEARAAERRGVPRASMSGALRERFLARRRPLVVAGTHGKTTTSAMCAWILWRAGREPGWFIGGVPEGLAVSAAIGSTRVRPDRGRAPFVVEGGGSDSVYWHKQPEFLDYVGVGADDIAIVTRVEPDRVDIAPNARSCEDALRALVRAVPPGGLVVCDAHDARARAIVAAESRAPVAWHSLERDDTGDVTPTWLGAPAAPLADGSQTFDLYAGGVACGRFATQVPGLHGVRSAIAALAACAQGLGVDVRDARAHLASFAGVRAAGLPVRPC